MPHPSEPIFWDERYASGTTPWDFGGVPSNLSAYMTGPRRPKTGRILVPGCGSAHEVKLFAAAGLDVTAIDFSPRAVERAREVVGPALAPRVVEADFFTHPFKDGEFDLVYERTFLCSLEPDLREAYRRRIAQLLKPRGLYFGYFFYKKTDPADGPPHGLAWGEGDELFSKHFLLLKDDPVEDSLPLFAGRERWQERMRTNKPA